MTTTELKNYAPSGAGHKSFGEGFSVERISEEFTGYVCKNKATARHIRKILPWLGFILRGIEKIKTGDWWIPTPRQLHFQIGPRRFKAKFNHEGGGGIDIVEIAKTPGQSDIGVVYEVRSITDAERFYRQPSAGISPSYNRRTAPHGQGHQKIEARRQDRVPKHRRVL